MTVLEYLKSKPEYNECPINFTNFITQRSSYYGSYNCCIDDLENNINHIADATMMYDCTNTKSVHIIYMCDIEWYSESEIIEAVNRMIRDKHKRIEKEL